MKNPFQWAYDAVFPKNKRQAPTGILRSEDAELQTGHRRLLVSSTRDLHRNFSLAAWMIRRHLDYVSTFSFQSKTGGAVDDQLERLMRWWSNPANCDATGRMSLQKLVRLGEMRRVIDGDLLFVKLSDGTIQAVEGDRLRDEGMPAEVRRDGDTWVQGVKLDKYGGHAGYAVYKRNSSGSSFIFERVVPARNAYHFAYLDRFDQVRGISPLAAAVNTLRDVYEGFDYALAKMKISQLFGLKITRKADDALGEPTEGDSDGYSVNFGNGPQVLDMDPGDDAQFLESATPSDQFQNFSQTMISVALKSLDIPYSFYAENFTNYSGARQALLQYELSAKIKRQDVIALLDHLTAWRIGLWVQDGVLPAGNYRWDWVPQGISWIDPMSEVQANVLAVDRNMTSLTRVLREQGLDFYEVVDERADELAYLASKGVPVMPAIVQQVVSDQPQKTPEAANAN